MSRGARLALFALSGPGLAVVLVLGLRGLPPFGGYHGVYGLVVAGVELSERRATDLVTALNFDIRAFDTLGEEVILFTSIVGVSVLLRQLRGEEEQKSSSVSGHRFAGASDSLRAFSLLLAPLLIALGWYLVFHGQLTPGGGFQGGVVLAAGPLGALLAGRYMALKVIAPKSALQAADALGAVAYVCLGLGGLAFAGIFLKNFLPLGHPGDLVSAGFMPLNSIAVGVEVTGAFLVVWTEMLDQALLVRRGGG